LTENYNARWVDLKQQHNWGQYFNIYEQIDNCPDIIKTHAFIDLLKTLPKKPVVFVYRHPFDTIISWYEYLQRPEYYQGNPSAPDMRKVSFSSFINNPFPAWYFLPFTIHCTGKNIFKIWNDWITGSLAYASENNAIFIDYAQLVTGDTEILQDFYGLKRKKTTIPDIKTTFSHLPGKGKNNRYKEEKEYWLEIIQNQEAIEAENNYGQLTKINNN
jgi:hypothetical protein